MLVKLTICLVTLLITTSRKPGSAASCRGEAVWDGNRCDCTDNQINLNGRCVCDYGYWLDGKNCVKCDSKNLWNGKPCAGQQQACPDGCKWAGNACSFDWTINNCGDGQYFNGKFCADAVFPVFCEAGYVWNQYACLVAVRSNKKCPDGNFWDGKQCTVFTNPPICADGSWDSYTGNCVVKLPTVPACDIGKFWNGKVCSSSNSFPVCPLGCFWNSKNCVAVRDTKGDVSCITGSYWTGEACLPRSNSVICRAAFHWDEEEKNCVSWGCRSGFLYDRLKQSCVDVSSLQGLNQLLKGPVIKDANGNVIVDTGGLSLLNGILSSNFGSANPPQKPFIIPTPPAQQTQGQPQPPTIVVTPGTTSTSGGS